MRNLTAFLLALAFLSLNACTEKINTKADEETIREWFDRYVASNNSGDFDRYGAFWTEDVIWLPPDSPAVEGREAILEYARPFFEQYSIYQEFTVEEIKVAGSFAFARIGSFERYTPKAEGKPMELNDKSIFILQRESDGTWISTHCIWNSNNPPAK